MVAVDSWASSSVPYLFGFSAPDILGPVVRPHVRPRRWAKGHRRRPRRGENSRIIDREKQLQPLAAIIDADSDQFARLFRSDLAQDSDFKSPATDLTRGNRASMSGLLGGR